MGPRRKALSSGKGGRSASQQTQDSGRGSGRQQAILVASIGAGATIIAAVIGLAKLDNVPASPSTQQPHPPVAAPPIIVPTPENHPHQPLVQMKSVVFGQSGDNRYIYVKGYIDTPNSGGELYVIAAPANGEPIKELGIAQTNVQRWYVYGPVSSYPDGSWEVILNLDPAESRNLTVEAIVISFCDYLPKGDPRCVVHAPARPAPTPSPSHPPSDKHEQSNPPRGQEEQKPSRQRPTTPSQSEDVRRSLELNGPKSVKARSEPTTVPVPHA